MYPPRDLRDGNKFISEDLDISQSITTLAIINEYKANNYTTKFI